MDYNELGQRNEEDIEHSLIFDATEALSLLAKHQGTKNEEKYIRKLNKIRISDLENIASNWSSILVSLESKMQSEEADSEIEERHERLMGWYQTIKDYLDNRKAREEAEAKAIGEAKIRRKLLEDKAAKEALEKAKQEGLSNLDAELQKIHWSEFASPCKKNPHSSMVLLSEGMIDQQIATKECLKGQKKGIMKNLEVTYDKAYVIEWLKVKVVSPLKELPLETIQSLIAEAYGQVGN
jgi:hypothetical protein